MVKYLRFLIGDPANPRYTFVLKRESLEEAWKGVLPVTEPGKPATPYTKGAPMMGLGFFVLDFQGHRLIYHDGDQGGFSSEMLIEPAEHTASILAVNTTDTGAPVPSTTLHPQSNTEPDPGTDLRLTLRQELLHQGFRHIPQEGLEQGSSPARSLTKAGCPTSRSFFARCGISRLFHFDSLDSPYFACPYL